MSPVLTIALLGRFAVAIGDRAVAEREWGSRKAKQLVKLLALAPQHRLATEQIFDALWPEQDPAGLAAAFRQTCYLARRALAHPGLLTLRGGVATLAPPGDCAVDCAAFEVAAAVARRTRRVGDYVAALGRYDGELLPDDRYADWVLVPAERLRELARGLRRELAALHEMAGDDADAETLWQTILADDPADEAAHVGLMGRYARQGQRQRAVRQYYALHALLRDDLDVAPDPATRRLYAAILGGHYPPARAPVAAAPVAALPPHRLPTSLTTLIGRGAEIATVGALVGGGARLLTLTGAGGCGKTRLALAVAEALLPTYPGGVWWVGLAPLAAGGLVTETVAQALGVRPQGDQTTLSALIAALQGRGVLLVLDNAEHLRAACTDLILALLRACPALRILVTSRAALRVVGEQVWRVPSLPVPAPMAAGGVVGRDVEALAANDAVRLFVARARLARAEFALTAGNAASVASICRRLEGLPLAIELAAARVEVLEPGQLAARLDDALGVLTGGAQGLPDRQRTLRATLDWSHALLSPDERRLLRRLAVFAGGWTLDAAEATGGGDALDVLTGLAGLVEHSLVQVDAGAGAEEPRYRLLEPTRQYAWGYLVASGEVEVTRAAHAAHVLVFAETIEPRLIGPDQQEGLRRLRREVDNLRAALGWYMTTGQVAAGLRLAAALDHFWRQQEFIREGWAWLSAGVSQPVAPVAEGPACHVLSRLAHLLGRWEEGIAFGQRSLRGFLATGDAAGQAYALSDIAVNYRSRGELAEAQRCLEEALALFQQAGDANGLIICTINLGVVAFDRGEVEQARAQLAARLPQLRAVVGGDMLAICLLNLATYTLTLRRLAGVRDLLVESLHLAFATDNQQIIACALAELADLATLEGGWVRAARLLGASQALHRRAELPTEHSEQPFHDRAESVARAALGDAAFAAAHAAGAALPLAEAIIEAIGPLPVPNAPSPTRLLV